MVAVKTLKYSKEVIAHIIETQANSDEVNFFTDPKETLQVGFQKRKKGKKIAPHLHPTTKEYIHGAKEVIYLIEGSVKVFFFNSQKILLDSYIIKKGDLLIQYVPGHSFEFLEDSQFIELKNGTYKKSIII